MTTTLQDRFADVRKHLETHNLERYNEIEVALLALLARQHVALIGPPGTAKSQLVRDLCEVFDAVYFERLMTRFTTPEEVFGPFSIPELREGRFERATKGYLPEAWIAFLDEVFKSNSAILNAILSIMNERVFHNGTNIMSTPLQSLFGASNELPESEELGALFDRFQFRLVVDYLVEPSNFISMLKLSAKTSLPKLSLDDLAAAQIAVTEVEIPDAIYETLYELRSQLRMDGIMVSDRRFRQALTSLRAAAWLHGRGHVIDDDFRVLTFMFWSQPQEIKRVQRIVLANTNPLDLKGNEILDQVNEIRDEVAKALTSCRAQGLDPQRELTKQGIEWYQAIKKLSTDLSKVRAQAEAQGKNMALMNRVRATLLEVAAMVGKSIMGLDLPETQSE